MRKPYFYDMQITAGNILMSASSMDDANFQKATLFITEQNRNGAMAFVINKIAERPLNALVEFSASPAFPLYNGGLVDKEHLYFIHRRADLINGGTQIIDNIFMGGDFKQAIKLINNKTLSVADIKIFIGYCGWDNGELEEEIIDGSWLLSNDNPSIVFL